MARPVLTVDRTRPGSVREQLRRTIALVGRGAREGSTYLPIRQWAARAAARARPKDYLGQLGELYREFTDRWRYVRDPLRAELVNVSGPAIWSNVYGGTAGGGRGWGDCDCASSGFAAAALSVGFPVRLVTSVPLRNRPGSPPRHIYPEVFVKGINRWIPADPVVWPKHGLGYASPARARQRWDLHGRNISGELAGEEVSTMFGYVADEYQDYGLDRYGYASIGEEPAVWGEEVGPIGFGAYADSMGIMGGFGLHAEVEEDEYGLARTPMLELHPRDWYHMRRYGRPYHGMPAIGDDGAVYQYDGLSGFFSKIFGGAKKLIGRVAKGAFGLAKKIGKKAWGLTRKVLSKLPGGKYLVRFVEKIHKTAMKLIRPLARFVGPLAKKIAPIAAMIPGYGPVISAALYAGGTVAQELAKVKGKQDPRTGRMHFPSGQAAKAFSSAMKRHAAKKRTEVRERAKAGEKPRDIIFKRRKPAAPGHLPAGTPEHKAALRAAGVKTPAPAAAPPALPAAAAPAAAPGGWTPPPEWWAEQQAEWAKEHPAAVPQA